MSDTQPFYLIASRLFAAVRVWFPLNYHERAGFWVFSTAEQLMFSSE